MEQLVGDHCVRLAYSLSEHKQLFEPHTRAMFWRSKEDREVDFVILGENATIPIEVKFQNKIKRDDLYALADFRKISGLKGGIVLSKDTLSATNGHSILPVSVFLLLI